VEGPTEGREGRFLADRRQELVSRARERGIDWEPAVENLPQDDDGLMIVALATLLEVDIQDALQGSKTLDEMEREKEQRDRERQRWEGMAVEETIRGRGF
jgi:hypothetical protein